MESQELPNATATPSVRKTMLDRLAERRAGMQTLVLRHLLAGDQFRTPVRCVSGKITVIDESLVLASDRGAAVPALDPSQIDIRFGSQRLHTSEIYICDSQSALREQGTVEALLSRYNVSFDAASLLRSAKEDEDVSVKSISYLGEQELRLLSALCGAFVRTRVVVFMNPFQKMSPVAAEAIGKFLIDRASSSEQVFLVCGAKDLPQSWKSNGAVQICQSGNENETQSPEKERDNADMLQQVRELSIGSRVVEMNASSTVTLPQIIARRGSAVENMAKTETIQSTDFHALRDEQAAFDGVDREEESLSPSKRHSALTAAKPRPGKTTNTLTRVGTTDRISEKFDLKTRWNALCRWLRGDDEQIQLVGVQKEARLRSLRREYKLRIILVAILAALLVTACALTFL